MKRKPRQYMLADIKKNIYDPHVFKSLKSAIHVNMVGQMYDNEKFFSVIPLSKTEILKSKMRRVKLL
jgi:hypothetical protein